MIILASASPRRKEILSLICDDFKVIPAKDEPLNDPSLSYEESVMRIARFKAEEIAKKYPECTVIGADTSVLSENGFLGKPKDGEDAVNMLLSLSNKVHRVYTATCIISPRKTVTFCECTNVEFCKLTREEAVEYVKSGEPMDKAGAYGIQGKGAKFVKRIDGDFYTVMGLPCARLYSELKKIGAI